ncbi:MAG: hypothetical protein RMY62_001460 [Nostoc sp. ZfuVER08]|jgi:hypothetical protein|nr:hypothetical protein [Nostoc sp. ZfuVER08]
MVLDLGIGHWALGIGHGQAGSVGGVGGVGGWGRNLSPHTPHTPHTSLSPHLPYFHTPYPIHIKLTNTPSQPF